MSAAVQRPVLALDVDGVLNPDIPNPGSVTHEVHVPAEDVPASPFVHGGGRTPLNVTVHLHPAHAAWLVEVQKVADVVWATTWEDAANRYLVPLLGVGPFPVGISITTNPPRFGDARNGLVDSWKAAALVDNFPGRPLAWVDDEAWRYLPYVEPSAEARAAFEAEVGGPVHFEVDPPWRADPTLVVVPEPSTGLSTAQMDQVLSWLTAEADRAGTPTEGDRP